MMLNGMRVEHTQAQYGVDFGDWIYVAKDETDARATQRCAGGRVIARTWCRTGWIPVDA